MKLPQSCLHFSNKTIKFFLLAICFILFVIQVQNVFHLYVENATVLGTTYHQDSNRTFPSVTICPEGVLKVKGFPMNRDDYDRSAFKLVTWLKHHTFLTIHKKYYSY
jgi:hypothetical protein